MFLFTLLLVLFPLTFLSSLQLQTALPSINIWKSSLFLPFVTLSYSLYFFINIFNKHVLYYIRRFLVLSIYYTLVALYIYIHAPLMSFPFVSKNPLFCYFHIPPSILFPFYHLSSLQLQTISYSYKPSVNTTSTSR